MKIKIHDWDLHFEQDRSRQWKNLKWVPIPNKQGLGYKKIMLEKNGAEIFGCWNALVQQASLCNPRGDLSKYTINDLSMKTMVPFKILESAIIFITQNLDWIEVIENLDKDVNNLDINVSQPAVDSSMLCSSIQGSSIHSLKSPEKLSSFSEFWSLYPKKTGKGAAEKSWSKIKEKKEVLEKIKIALKWQVKSAQWKNEDGKYIPMPVTYLNQKRWEDEPFSKAKIPAKKIETIPKSEHDQLMAEIKADQEITRKRLMGEL